MRAIQGFILISALAFNATAFAALTTFNDRDSFLVAAGALTTIDFSGIVSAGDVATFPAPSGIEISNVTFVGSGVAFPSFFDAAYVADHAFCCAHYSGRTGTLASLGTPLSAPGINARNEISLPGGVTAVGMQLFSVTSGQDEFQTDQIRIEIGTEIFEIETVGVGTGDGLVFFGVISDAPLTTLTIAPTRLDFTTSHISRFEFSAAGNPVPVPGAVWLLGSALAGLLAKGRRAS